MTVSIACAQPGCTGTIAADHYCDTCGAKAPAQAQPPKGASASADGPSGQLQGEPAPSPARPATAASAPARGSLVTGSARSAGTRRTSSTRSTRSTSSRSRGIGAGIVDVPIAPPVDPGAIVLLDDVVPERKRFCSSCGAPVGRARPDAPEGRVAGVCSRCRHRFDFQTKLARGQLVGGQYEVAGPLAHGGLGWIYLARDKAVNDRWVVLKGLLDSNDEAAMRAALAERQYLAQLSHPAIVEIFNFVTDRGSGYIVMEFVGGKSLKQMLADRRAANGGVVNPLPVDEALAFVLAALPAFGYLHERGLLYCDFKPDNLLQVGDQVKVIDLGAVRRVDDDTSDIYGTVGYQAPEIATVGPSVASDIYTIGRTLAVLTLDFRGYQKEYAASLPDPADHPVLTRFDSFYRLLLKATAPHPDDRFQSIGELTDQALGVLREAAAITTGKPQVATSSVFGPAPDDDGLPVLAVDPADSAAGFLANLSGEPGRALAELSDAFTAGTVQATVEARLRLARALLDVGEVPNASQVLDEIEKDDPWEWRVAWLRGRIAFDVGDMASAEAAFDRCRSEVPGELAPKLAAAIVAERAGDTVQAATTYEIVTATDPNYITAARGLGRMRAATGDIAGALAAYDRVPAHHRAHADAQADVIRLLLAAGRYREAANRLDAADEIDERTRAAIEVDMFAGALAAMRSNGRNANAGGGVAEPGFPVDAPIAGRQPNERTLRRALEQALRRQADLVHDRGERVRLIDRANRERPVTVL